MVLPLLVCMFLLVLDVTRSHSNSHRTNVNTKCTFNSMCTCQFVTRSGNDETTNYKSSLNVQNVACIGVPFSKLPELSRGNFSQLDVADTGLEMIHSDSLALAQIDSLRLMNNKIRFINDKALSSMTRSLTSLDLSYNQLDQIPFNALKDLKNLQWLNLVGNQIQNLNGDWSYMEDTLTSLLISENDINEIPDIIQSNMNNYQINIKQSLRNLHVLDTLNLDNNHLVNIAISTLPKTLKTLGLANNLLIQFPNELIDELIYLQWLDLRGNNFINLPNYSFKPFRQIEKLDLGENRIESLPKLLFNNTMQIRDFNLDFNQIDKLINDIFFSLNCGRLVLSFNFIRSIQSRAFHGLDNSLEYLNLEHNYLHFVPAHAFNRLNVLKYLYLSSNFLTEIPQNAFDTFAQTLRALSLSGNQLNQIPFKALQNCTKLVYLNLAYNQIIDIDQEHFQNWSFNLNTLLLSSNRILTLDESVFNTTKNLRELTLSFNPLSNLHVNLFQYLNETLEMLELSFALSLEQFPADLLKPLHNILWLAFDNNDIEYIHKNSLDSFNLLQYLSLESNKLISLPSNLFQSDIHRQLTDLRLANNLIESIESNTFDSLPIQSVMLNHNRIKYIRTKSFNNLTNLVKIYLSNNKIKTIEPAAFTHLPVLQKLDLQNNNLLTFSMQTLVNSTNNQYPLNLNLSNNNIFEILPTKNVLHVKTIDLSRNNLQIPPKYMLENLAKSLQHLYLGYNQLELLEQEALGRLNQLEILNLHSNHIRDVSKHAFIGLDALQILDLSYNEINTLHVGQFINLDNLRVLDLSFNQLRHLPKDLFRNTAIQQLKLSSNYLNTIPNLNDIRSTLNILDVSQNNIEHIDSTMFLPIPNLLQLDLSSNRLNLLPDNVFTSLSSILRLDLSSNPLRANYKELFHYAQSLQHLNLANVSLHSLPTLPLPNLIYLNVASNELTEMRKAAVASLSQLRILDLSYNNFKVIPAHAWTHLMSLHTLKLSNNPIKEISSKSFIGLNTLKQLELDSLTKLKHIDIDSFSHLDRLRKLKIPLTSKIKLHPILANITKSLRSLSLDVIESHLTVDHLQNVLTSRIKELEIFGINLKSIDRDVFKNLDSNIELLLHIHHTQISELPSGLVGHWHRIPHLRLDLRNNQLTSLIPDIFYSNMTAWENAGTKLISGGLLLEHNPWICDCQLIWLGHWLRRWLVESLQVHTLDPDTVQIAYEHLKRAYCTHPETGYISAIVDLRPEHMSCQASALSTTASTHLHDINQPTTILFFIGIICLYTMFY